MRKIIHADGTEKELEKSVSIAQAEKLISADTIGTFMLADRKHVMLLDDMGHPKMLPINHKATVLYHQRCRPGTTHEIRGDVVIVPDSDFGGGE